MVEFFVICCILFGCAATVRFFRTIILFIVGMGMVLGLLGIMTGGFNHPAPAPATTPSYAAPTANTATHPNRPTSKGPEGLRVCRGNDDQGPCLQTYP